MDDLFDQFLEAMNQAAAAMLQRAALTLQQAATADYRQGKNPPPYKTPAPRGIFPRVRTGFLASSLIMSPAGISQIRSLGYVRVGYAANAFYGIALGKRGWKWLQDTLDMHRPRIEAALSGVATIHGFGGIM